MRSSPPGEIVWSPPKSAGRPEGGMGATACPPSHCVQTHDRIATRIECHTWLERVTSGLGNRDDRVKGAISGAASRLDAEVASVEPVPDRHGVPGRVLCEVSVVCILVLASERLVGERNIGAG